MTLTEERKRLNRKYRWVVREGITKCLRKHGFNQKGPYYWRDCDPTVALAITVMKARVQWKPDVSYFSITCGMVAHVVCDLYEEVRELWAPNAYVGQIQVNPERLTSKVGSDFSISSASSDDDLAALARTITQVLEDVVLPWYSKFKTARDVGDYILSPGDGPGKSWFEHREIKHNSNALCDAAIAYLGAGEYDRALGLLDLADKTIDRTGQHRTDDLRERMKRFIAQRQKKRRKS